MPAKNFAALIESLSWRGAAPARTCHLAVGDARTVSLIMKGKKKVETRFSVVRQPPFGKVSPGDLIVFKKTAGPIVATAKAARVMYFAGLTRSRIQRLRDQFDDLVQAGDEFWGRKMNARYGTVIFLSDVELVTPTRVDKRDRRAWVVWPTSHSASS